MNWRDLLQTAESTAREAGGILKEGAEHLRNVEFSDQRDVKLRADMDSEELIRSRLEQATNYPVYGEEKGGDASLQEKDEPYWVVDPLDGTYNYLRGSNLCAVSIGLLQGLEPVLGVIYDFNSDTCYSGYVDHGMFVNGEKAIPDWADSIGQAALATGFPAGMDRGAERMEAFIKRIAPYKKVRMVGSAALALAFVGGGIYDVYYEETIRLWDVAAGIALIRAAGGDVRITPSPTGKPLAFDVWAGKGDFFRD
ncbi:MAG: inositol monophosphatase [Puniceicoccaceae bacterium]